VRAVAAGREAADRDDRIPLMDAGGRIVAVVVRGRRISLAGVNRLALSWTSRGSAP
jgi:hypothetical protein